MHVKTYRDTLRRPAARTFRSWGDLLVSLVIMICAFLWPVIGHTQEKTNSHTAPEAQSATPREPEPMAAPFSGTVREVINAGRYVYLHVETEKRRVWVAVPAFDGKSGDEVLVPPGVPVADFQSSTLHRRFKMIYFVGSVRRIVKHPQN
jgi:hypothetical protein